MTHIMLDLETFGTAPGCALRSIGAVVFDPHGTATGEEYYANIDKQSCLDAGLVIDPKTEHWWTQQEAKAQEALLLNPIPLLTVIGEFHDWFNHQRGVQVWGQGANFDEPIWQGACRATGFSAPWKFFNARDTRTVYELGQLDTRSITREGLAHNALDDAKFQVKCVQAAIAKINPSMPSHQTHPITGE